ncbi:MAG: glycosyltransferase [Bryobacteraceae bacterium]|nr:glycosyltransferase [Bryobacteraceae bacterium]
MTRLGILIVTYHSAGHIEACLSSLPGRIPILVIDNASTDSTADLARRHPAQPEVIANMTNLGFAGAVNQGFRHLDTEFVLLLNPDVELREGLPQLIEALHDPQAGAATGELADQFSFHIRRLPTPWTLVFEVLGLNRLWPTNPVNRRYRCRDLNPRKAQNVEQPAAAFLLIRHQAWQQIGGFDERFHPVWFEDVDFCQRLQSAGWSIRYEPRAHASHSGGHSVNKLTWACKQQFWYGSLLKYAAKHFGWWELRLVALAILIAFPLRCSVEMFHNFSVKPLRTCAKVAGLALSSMFGDLPTPTESESR